LEKKLDSLINVNEVGLEQLLFWNDKLKKEINERVKDMKCPYCDVNIEEPYLNHCNYCGGNIKWIWEE